MLSNNVEVQCNAVGCVTNLATHGETLFLHLNALNLLMSRPDDNKTKIAKSGALVPLTRLARSKDLRVQRNATGALLNMTHSGQYHPPSNRFVSHLRTKMRTASNSSMLGRSLSWLTCSILLIPMCSIIVQLRSATSRLMVRADGTLNCALKLISVKGGNRKKLAQSEPKLVQSLVSLMDSPSLKVQCQAALALRNLASDGEQSLCPMM